MVWDISEKITTGPAVAKCRETSPSIGQRDITRPREWEQQRTEVKVNEKEGMEEEINGPAEQRDGRFMNTTVLCSCIGVMQSRCIWDTHTHTHSHTHTFIHKIASVVTCAIPHSSRWKSLVLSYQVFALGIFSHTFFSPHLWFVLYREWDTDWETDRVTERGGTEEVMWARSIHRS